MNPVTYRAKSAYTLVEVMMVTAISAFVFAGVLSAYMFLGRGLARQGFAMELEGPNRIAMAEFNQDVSAATGFTGLPTSNGFTVTLLVAAADPIHTYPPPVAGTASYSYTAGTASAPGTLTITRQASIAASGLGFPNWPGTTVVKGIQTLAFQYLDMYGNSTSNQGAIKQIVISYTAANPTTYNPAQSSEKVTAVAVLKNKLSLQ